MNPAERLLGIYDKLVNQQKDQWTSPISVDI